jgi:tRNA-Thr(GGU) m(6)t(6)A37 methyltransferase TsaA
MELKPIGTIKTQNHNYQAKIDQKYLPALEGLNDFSHIIILWWADKCDNPEARNILNCKKPYKKSPDTLGTFSTRSPARPNPIASSVVQVLSIEPDGTIHLPYIDADDNTPILDIKPYHPSTDKVKNLLLPPWCQHWPQYYEESGDFDWESEFTYEE